MSLHLYVFTTTTIFCGHVPIYDARQFFYGNHIVIFFIVQKFVTQELRRIRRKFDGRHSHAVWIQSSYNVTPQDEPGIYFQGSKQHR